MIFSQPTGVAFDDRGSIFTVGMEVNGLYLHDMARSNDGEGRPIIVLSDGPMSLIPIGNLYHVRFTKQMHVAILHS
jgi:hypothetical protein